MRKNVKHPTALAILNFNKDITMTNVGYRILSVSVTRYGTDLICLNDLDMLLESLTIMASQLLRKHSGMT